MAKIEASTIEKYQLILAKDPNSQVFAPLAEAYREMGLLKEAYRTVTAGVQRHPQFVGGQVIFARVYREIGEFDKAIDALKKAVQLAPENILAHRMMAEIYLAQKNPKDALKAFKMVLFLNPQSESAKKAVTKLESITADEYDDEVFSMEKLPEVKLQNESPLIPENKILQAQVAAPQPQKALERMLSLIDAFIVRNDLEKAQTLLRDTEMEYGKNPEITRRLQSLQIRFGDGDEATPLKPLKSRDQLIQQKKLDTLNMLLRRIEHARDMDRS